MFEMTPPVARTPVHDWHVAHGARFTNRDGWQVVTSYNVTQPLEQPRLKLADISAFGKITYRGPGTTELITALMPGNAALKRQTAMRADSAPLTVCRLTEDRILLLQAPDSTLAEWKTALLN